MKGAFPILVMLWVGPVTPQAVFGAGAIAGDVRFVDAYPESEAIRVTKDLEVCGTKKAAETFVVSPETKGLLNAVISLVGAEGESGQAGSAEILQKGCGYAPHVQVVRPGTELNIINDDGILHNVHAYTEGETLFNLAQPKYRKVLEHTLVEPAVIHLKCDVHEWMEAWIVVTDEPFVTLTDENGSYRLEGVPSGAYKVRLWHEALGIAEKDVTVVDGTTVEVNFQIGE